MADEKLKPCPFCGGEHISKGYSFVGGLNTLTCENCRASVQFHFVEWDDCIALWNRRADND